MDILKKFAIIMLVVWIAAASWVMYRLAVQTAMNVNNINVIATFLNNATKQTAAPATTTPSL